jgi:hypothetical protein
MDDIRKCSRKGCNGIPTQARKLCGKCLAIASKSKKKQRVRSTAKGLCGQCGCRPSATGRKLCDNCREKLKLFQREKVTRYRAEGRCITCGKFLKGRQKASSWCRPCHLRKLAYDNLADPKRGKEIGTLLYNQNSRCVYTGIPLVLGVNASLDHIIPRSKGGSDDLSNLQWVDTRLNLMRKATADEDFK